MEGRSIRKGAADAIANYLKENGSILPDEVRATVDAVARQGGTPLVVAENGRALGVIHLKDIVKGGMKERFEQLRAMGIKTIMITGDNPLTAAAIAREAGVDDFLAEAKPKDKMDLIKREQAQGKLVAMTGDGTNDAPALAQADVGVAMNSGTQAAKEAGNMVRPRLQPDQADRDCGHWQAVADDARRADDVLDCERCGEVLRYYSGHVHGGVPGDGRDQHHASEVAGVGDSVGGHLQRADYCGTDSAGAAWRQL